jgi:5-(carboxyamino)imidazole ribonucleotide synthase
MSVEANPNVLGIVGGGQLGRMITLAAKPMGFEVVVVDPGPNSPAAQVGAEQIVAPLDDPDGLAELAERTDVITAEIEHIGTEVLLALQAEGAIARPDPAAIALIKDKLYQKSHLAGHGLPVADFLRIDGPGSLATAKTHLGGIIVKARTGGFDGRGNLVLGEGQGWADVQRFFGPDAELYAEEIVPFRHELAVVAAKDVRGRVLTYPVVETFQHDNICHTVEAPANIGSHTARVATEIAREVVDGYVGAGIYAVELFVDEYDRILVNEVAPRVHNSGHWTIEGAETSQFANAVRAVMGLPLGSTELRTPTCMVNIIGERNGPVELRGLPDALAIRGVAVHLYGKSPTRQQRKMGHVTATALTIQEARAAAEHARSLITI